MLDLPPHRYHPSTIRCSSCSFARTQACDEDEDEDEDLPPHVERVNGPVIDRHWPLLVDHRTLLDALVRDSTCLPDCERVQ